MEPSTDNPESNPGEWLEKLAGSGYRVTGKIRAIVATILHSPRALDAVDIFDMARREYPGLGLVTVYRTLQKLEELGLVEHLHQAGGCNRVIRAARGHEHFLVCNRCGRVVYFSGDNLNSLTDQIAQQTGFAIQSHWLQLFGLCAACRAL
jgi:Fur family transcriptional regulator, ferric uptake regulator